MIRRGVARGIGALLALAIAACASTGGTPDAGADRAGGPVVLAPSLAGVDPRLLPELERVQRLIAEGHYAAARGVLDALRAREGDRLAGTALDAARAFESVLDLDPTFLPSLQALEQAVDAGQDREAAAILRRIELRRPRGRVLDIARAYRRILDGRAVVASLRLRLECRPEVVEDPPENAPEGARYARLVLVAESGLVEPVLLETGPATLFVTRSVVGRSGIERDAVETRTFEDLRAIEVGPGKTAEIPLAGMYVSAGPGELASRIRFELDVRSGSARIRPRDDAQGEKAERDVPVMRLRVAETEETAYAAELRELPPAAPEELLAIASEETRIDLAAALAIAVRIPPRQRERTLDLLAPQIAILSEDAVRALVPALRWIAVTSEPGGGPGAWRGWFLERERKKTGERPKLLLPRATPERANP